MHASSPTTILGLPGEIASTPPSVQLASAGKPVKGVSVSFTFSDGRGVTYSTVTNAYGVAILENLRFDNRPGQYSITATVAGVDTVVFSVISIGGQLIAEYDLRMMGGEPASGAHYQLFDDGTYRHGYDRDGQTQWHNREPFIRRSDSRIEFYLSAADASGSSFYASVNYLSAVGTLKGNTMAVVYEDEVDFEDEDYSLAN
jgi:hypothetical protein